MLDVFQTEITVPPSAIDALHHANNVAYLQWIQDVAEQHWLSKTNPQIRKKYAWVVLNHFIEYKAPSFKNETLILKTWVTHSSGVTTERHTQIIRKNDEKILATAKTVWCLILQKTQKPIRLTEEITSLFL
ncbi:MAG: acyl-CoA thioesterase [Bacteroidetes bacterium HGW-Bacteroidetes-2]|nr:MAG: acyl-CoA thioesterase [Bacteroidetes bacterium HGW-Bacteroidetes-2]